MIIHHLFGHFCRKDVPHENPPLSHIWRCLEPISFQKREFKAMGYWDFKYLLTREMPHTLPPKLPITHYVVFSLVPVHNKNTKLPITQGKPSMV